MNISPRNLFGLIAFACIGLLSFGFYLEHFEGLEPCPLCIFQRMTYMAITLVALVAFVTGLKRIGAIVSFALLDLLALVGLGIAGRQVWLQHLPEDKVPECGPGLDYMLDVFSFMEALEMIFTGSGECAEVNWRFLGFSIAEWSLVMFICILIATAIGIIQTAKAMRH